jgi:DNA-binding IclR family transcriptional regulator
MQQKNQNTYKSVSHIAGILLCLSNGMNTVSEIAKYRKLSKSTVSRLLQALTRAKLASRDPFSRKYYLGHLLTQLLANPKTAHDNLIHWSIGEMSHLSETSGETVILSVMIGIQQLMLHVVPTKFPGGGSENENLIGPQLFGATAKVLFSQLSDEELRIALKNIDIDRLMGFSISDYKDKLVDQLNDIRTQGHIVTHGDRSRGIIGISAPIKYYICPAALTIRGPENRLSPQINRLTRELKDSTNRISSSISEIFQLMNV